MLVFSLLQCKFFAKIIGQIINICNFAYDKRSGIESVNLVIKSFKLIVSISGFQFINQ